MDDFQTPDVLNAAGLAGVVLDLGSYALLQAGMIRGASSLVLVSLTVAFNMSSAIIQVSWIVISLMGIARMAWLNSRARFSGEERAMLARAFPDMPPPMARRFLNGGNWFDAEAGGPASAMVRASAPSRLFVILGSALQQLTARDPDFRIVLENGMSRDTGRKLMRANARLSEQEGA